MKKTFTFKQLIMLLRFLGLILLALVANTNSSLVVDIGSQESSFHTTSIHTSRTLHPSDRSSRHHLSGPEPAITSQRYSDPPPKNETARMARYIVHFSDWAVLAHISRHANTSGYPAARVYSIADGWYNTSTGIPYFYVSRMDHHIDDLATDGRCSLTISLAEGEYCRKESLDPEDPRCAQIILTGQFKFLDKEKDVEAKRAMSYLFQRHPIMQSWPVGHAWKVGKIKIGHIQVADNFGGSAYPSVEEYFAAQP